MTYACLTILILSLKSPFSDMKRFILLSCLFVFSGWIQAQPELDEPAEMVQELQEFRRQEFTQRLSLTPTEAEAFFPIYDQSQLELRQARMQFRKKWGHRELGTLTEEEAKAYYADAVAVKQKELDIHAAYTPKLAPIIGYKRVVLLPQTERDVRAQLLKRARGMDLPPGPEGRPPRGQ